MKTRFARAALGLATVLAIATVAADQPPSPPAWWQPYGITLGQSVDPDPGPNQATNGTVTMGQLKDWALDTRDYLDSTLAADGGAGQSVTDAVNALDDSDPATPATVAQFRSVMQPIYDRLIAAGYDTKASLQANGAGTDWKSIYPWPDAPAGPNDLTFDADAYAAWFQQQANIVDLGQARLALSFDLSGLTLITKVIGPEDGGISIRKNGHAGSAAEVEATANGNEDSSSTAKNGSATIAKAFGASAPAMQVVDNSELSLIVLTPLE